MFTFLCSGYWHWVYTFLEIHTSWFWFIVYSLAAFTISKIIIFFWHMTHLICTVIATVKSLQIFLARSKEEREPDVSEVFSDLKDTKGDSRNSVSKMVAAGMVTTHLVRGTEAKGLRAFDFVDLISCSSMCFSVPLKDFKITL